MLSQSKIILKELWNYSGKQSNQRSAVVEIKVPVPYREVIEKKHMKILKELCGEIYEDDSDYGFTGVEIGVVLLSTVQTVNHLTKEVRYLQNHSNYQNLMDKVVKMDIDGTQKMYIYEACNSAISGNNIAAITMLGCASELLLMNLCESYKVYLQQNGEESKAETFTNKVIKARNPFARVDEFYKRVISDPSMTIFSQYGLENLKIQFNLLDIIRQVRNSSGHPTGERIVNEDLSTTFGNFQLLIEKLYKFINDYKGEPASSN